MGGKIQIKYNPTLTKMPRGKRANNLLSFVKRVARILETNENVQPLEDLNWQLGTSNDWWLAINIQTQEFIITSRYIDDPLKLEHIRQAIIIILGLQRFNQEKN